MKINIKVIPFGYGCREKRIAKVALSKGILLFWAPCAFHFVEIFPIMEFSLHFAISPWSPETYIGDSF